MSALPAAIGRYEVQAFIARGGMGTLYLASDPVLQRQVAIKLLREADNDELRARFTREARSAANLRHRNIVTIFDVGDHDGQPFMAMEYIQGQTLTSLIERDPPPSIIRRLELVEDLCDGLAYAHKRGVVHRDVKPANLMVETDGTLKILDFGIARAAAEAGMTQAGLMIGTLNYMSPEQVAGADLDGRSDMFAVGAVLYELLARRPAFPGSIDGGVLNRILNGEPEPLEALCPHLDPAIYRIVRRALAKSPADRYPDLLQMRTELSQARQTLETSALADLEETFAAAPPDESTMPAARPPRRGTDREELVRRRTQQIEDYLATARAALSGGDFDAAIAACEQALVLDPNDGRAFDLAERARLERDRRQAEEILGRARESMKKGDLTLASSLIREALSMTPESTDAIELGRLVGEARLAQERERQREAAVHALLVRAQEAMDRGELDEAASGTRDALALSASHPEALRLDEAVTRAVAAREREVRDAEARQTALEARALFAAGQHADALALLESFLPAHPVVSQAWTELSTQAARELEDGEAPLTVATPQDATLLAPRSEPFSETRVAPPRGAPADTRPTPAVAATLMAPAAAVPVPAAARGTAGVAGQPVRSADAGSNRPGQPGRSRTAMYAGVAAVLVLASLGAYIAFQSAVPDSGAVASNAQPAAPEAGSETVPAAGASAPQPSEPAAAEETVAPVGTPPSPPAVPAPEPARPTRQEAAASRPPVPTPTPATATASRPPAPAPEERPAVTPRPPERPVAPPEPTPEPVSAPPPITTTTLPPPAQAAAEVSQPRPPAATSSPPAATPAAPPPPPVVPDRQLIETALAALARGYSTLDVAAVAAVFPSVNRRTLQDTFDDTRRIEMRVEIRDIRIDGNTAVVESTVHQLFQGRVSGERKTAVATEFRLRRSGPRWIIESRR